MRVKISGEERKKIFLSALKYFGNFNKFSKGIKVNRRTLNDWQRGISTIPLEKYNKFIRLLNFRNADFSPKILNDYWHIKRASKKGGLARLKLYGEIGTPEGRRKGGLASLATHKSKKTLFYNIKSIKEANESKKLAEFFGILFGDGHLSNYQACVYTSSQTDREHALHTKKLIKDLFEIIACLKVKKNKNVINIVASSRNLVRFLNNKGMPIGNKIKNKLRVPDWIKNNSSYKKAFIRGLFDTDGCVYLDRHKINNKIYKYLGWTITSYASNLILDVINILKECGFSPTNRLSQKSVYLRRQKEIVRYFNEIKTNNPKHYNRFIKFNGEVPKWL